jgi:hypothetical protein
MGGGPGSQELDVRGIPVSSTSWEVFPASVWRRGSLPMLMICYALCKTDKESCHILQDISYGKSDIEGRSMICMPCLKALLCPEDGNIDPVIARSHGGEAIPTTGSLRCDSWRQKGDRRQAVC